MKGLRNKFGDGVEVGVCPFFSAVAPTFRAQVCVYVCASPGVGVCAQLKKSVQPKL